MIASVLEQWTAALMKMLVATFVALKGYLFPQEAPPLLQLEQSPRGISYLRIWVPNDDTIAVRMTWDRHWSNWQGVNQDVPRIAARLMMEGGAEGRPAAEVIEDWADTGGTATLSVKLSEHTLSINVPSSGLDAALRLANAHLRAPELPEPWFRRLRDQIAAGNEEAAGVAANQLNDTLYMALIGDGPERRSKSHETAESVRRLSLEDVRIWHKAVFTRSPDGVIIAGEISKDAAGRAVDRLVEGLPDKPVEPPGIKRSQAAAHLSPRRILLHLPHAKASRLIIAGAVSGPATLEDWVILDSLAGRGGLLAQTARDRLRASYDFSWNEEFLIPKLRIFRLEGNIETARLGEVAAALRTSYASFHRTLAPLQTQGTRRRVLKTVWWAQTDAAGAADWVNANWWVDAGKDILDKPVGYLNYVNNGTIAKRLHEAFPKPEELIFIAVSPDAEALPDACVITAPEQAVNCR